jgi:hypothetical protein
VTDEPKKRRARTATERDLEGIQAAKERARKDIAAFGVPIVGDDNIDFTPVGQVLEKIDDPNTAQWVRDLWKHTANIEMRSIERARETSNAALAARIGDLELAIVDIRGEAGTNGKLGALRERVDKAESRRWWAVTALAGMIVTVLGGAIAVGRWVGSIETDVEVIKERLDRRDHKEIRTP